MPWLANYQVARKYPTSVKISCFCGPSEHQDRFPKKHEPSLTAQPPRELLLSPPHLSCGRGVVSREICPPSLCRRDQVQNDWVRSQPFPRATPVQRQSDNSKLSLFTDFECRRIDPSLEALGRNPPPRPWPLCIHACLQNLCCLYSQHFHKTPESPHQK